MSKLTLVIGYEYPCRTSDQGELHTGFTEQAIVPI